MIAQPLRHRDHFWFISLLAFAACVALALLQLPARGDDLVKHPTFYRTTKVDGLSIFYREAGPSDAPTLLLLHGFPSSSRMFEPLFARLSDRYHLVAPDYPGFGHSDWPDTKAFNYTFRPHRLCNERLHPVDGLIARIFIISGFYARQSK